MRVALTLALLLAAAPLAPAADAALRARVALALALASPPAPVTPLGCRCATGSPCRCIECDCPGGHPDDRRLSFNAGYDRALAERKPLVTWIGLACPPCERELTGCVHVHASSLHGDVGPCVIVSLPEGGKLYRRVRLVGQPSAEAIRPYLQPAPWVLPPRPVPPPPHPWYGTVPPVSPVNYPAFQPAFYAPAPSPFFGGGFGGACGPRG